MTSSPILIVLTALLGGAIRVSTPFMFVALGETLTEKSGRINLGLEGTLVLGAMLGYATAYLTGSPWLGVLAGGFAGVLLGTLHGLLCSLQRVNDIAIGIAMMTLGTGLAFFFGKPYIQPEAPHLPSIPLADWTGDKAFAEALRINPLFFVGIAAALAMAWGFRNTRVGLIVRTTGDSAPAARAMGVPVDLVRILSTAAGGFLAGVGGSFLSLYYPGLVERGAILRAGPDGGGARHLRALEPYPLRDGGPSLRRRGGAGPGVAIGRHHPGLLPLQRRPLHPDTADHDRVVELERSAPGRPRRTLHHPIGEPMNGLGGLNKSPNGVVIGLVQLQLPVVATPDQLAAQTAKIVRTVAKARANLSGMDLVVFPEYALHGLSMATDPSHHVPHGWAGGGSLPAGLRRQPHLGLLLHHGVQPARQSLQRRARHRFRGRREALLPQDASLGCRLSLGSPATSASRSSRDRTARSSGSSSAMTACSRRWRANAPTRAPRS